MKWDRLLSILEGEPVFHSTLPLAGMESDLDFRRQLSRWVASGRLLKLGRSWYAIASRYRTRTINLFNLANRLKPASYVSLQSVLSHHGLIPESVPIVTSVTTGRPETIETPLGAFSYRHVARSLFFGYRSVEVAHGISAFLATPEKAILDLVHLTAGGSALAYLEELRLQNTETLDLAQLRSFADRAVSPKLRAAARRITHLHTRQEGG